MAHKGTGRKYSNHEDGCVIFGAERFERETRIFLGARGQILREPRITRIAIRSSDHGTYEPFPCAQKVAANSHKATSVLRSKRSLHFKDALTFLVSWEPSRNSRGLGREAKAFVAEGTEDDSNLKCTLPVPEYLVCRPGQLEGTHRPGCKTRLPTKVWLVNYGYQSVSTWTPNGPPFFFEDL